MTGRDIPAMGSALSFLSALCTIQKLGNKCYASNAAWKEFLAQVAVLQDKHMKLTTQLENYKEDVVPALQEAEELLREEVQRLEETVQTERLLDEIKGCGKLCCKVSFRRRKKFPKEVSLVVGDAIRSYDRISEKLSERRSSEENNATTSMPPIPVPSCIDLNIVFVKDELMDIPMPLEGLVAILRTNKHPLKSQALAKISKLAEGTDQATRDLITNFPGLLDDLESFLDPKPFKKYRDTIDWEKDSSRLIWQAAMLLANVAPTRRTSKLIAILAAPMESNNPARHLSRAQGLSNLARADNDDVKSLLLAFPRVLVNLARLLDKDESDGQFQTCASKTLLHLSSSQDKAIKAKLLRAPFLLKRLGTSLGKTQNPDLQRNALSILVNLSGANADITREMANTAVLMDEVAKLLDHESLEFRESAAVVLSYLRRPSAAAGKAQAPSSV